jgi:hypothetical protein
VIRAALAVAVLFAAITAAAAQQPVRSPRSAASPRAATGNAAIVGTVTAADTGVPLRQAIVSVVSSIGFPREVVTDDRGRFELRDLDAGPWQLTVSRNGYISRKFGQTRPFGPAQPVVLAAGQQLDVQMPLTRASAIVGRVFDEWGEPVTAARVTVLRPVMVRQQRYLEPIGEGDFTDDTGAFRLHSLPAGEYYVAASSRLAPPDSVVQTTLSPTFYPGTAEFAAAQKVRVGTGAEAVADFALVAARTARVSGFVTASNGRAADAFISLTSEAGELGTSVGAGGVTREDGSFTLADIAPGTYTLLAEVRSGISSIAEVGTVAVTVNGADVGGVTVLTAKPGSVRGRIVADAGVKRPLPDGIDVYARPRRPGAQNTFATTSGTEFELTTPPGPFTVEVAAPDGWAVKSMSLGGIDASDLAIDIGGEQAVPLTVVLTDRTTEVSGSVAAAAAAPAYVVVFPADSGTWTPRRIRRAETDARGRFRILGLPPGDRYFAVAVRDLDDGQELDPEFLQRVQPLATSLDLPPEARRTVDLQVIER